MEVHHHSHTERKKWNHYFWEFFMLFLAVFCGFLAEYHLEHMIEKKREKQYIGSLLKDLENDTLRFGKTITRLEQKIPYYDSVLSFFKNPLLYNNSLPFRFYIKTNLEQFYSPSNSTLEQLKGSGNLRLIHKQSIIDSIVFYDSRINGAYKNQVEYVIEANKRLIHSVETIFDFTNFNRFINDVFADTAANDESDYDKKLFTNDKAAMQAVYNTYISTKATDVFYIQSIISTRKIASGLILFLKKEYHLE
ncbi:MAG TPA: hypothetical protein VK492_09620 [Chitinophagaceae bacterium]|nr:hypothetical protein [Chitinophagaceae bacterium]